MSAGLVVGGGWCAEIFGVVVGGAVGAEVKIVVCSPKKKVRARQERVKVQQLTVYQQYINKFGLRLI